jgi:hypothetical protein
MNCFLHRGELTATENITDFPVSGYFGSMFAYSHCNITEIARADDLCTRADDLCTRADDLCTRADDLCTRADDLCARADDLCTRADDLCTRADDLCTCADDLCRREDDLCTYIIPKSKLKNKFHNKKLMQ